MSIMDVPLTGAGGAGGIGSPLAPTQVPQAQQLVRNPQLPQHPLGAYTDSEYAAQNAMLRANIAKQYADTLQQLGYVDPQTGQFVMGSVETNANRQRGDVQHSLNLARKETTDQAQQQGTLFSGRRGDEEAKAAYPFMSSLANLDVDTPLSLQQLYEHASGLIDDYTLQDNQLIAAAAARQAAGLTASGGGLGGGTDAGGTGGGGAGADVGATYDPLGLGNFTGFVPGFSSAGGGAMSPLPGGPANAGAVAAGMPSSQGPPLTPSNDSAGPVAPPPPATTVGDPAHLGALIGHAANAVASAITPTGVGSMTSAQQARKAAGFGY